MDIDGARTAQTRIRLIQRAVQDPLFAIDMSKGITAIQKKGFGKGHPTLIEALWPKGTIARSDIEGIQTLVKSIPERVEELRGSDTKSLFNVVQSTSQDFPLSKAVQRAFEDRERSLTVAQNVFRRDPKQVETLDFREVAVIESEVKNVSVEIRTFEKFEMVACKLKMFEDFTLTNMGSGLVKLSSYVLGFNSEEKLSEMTTPFIMQNSIMWIKRPFDMANVKPSDGEVSIEQRPSQTLALLEFSGICTNPEFERQRSILKDVLAADLKWTITDDSVLVLQYNAPGTLPWRRKNEIGFLVEEVKKPLTWDDIPKGGMCCPPSLPPPPNSSKPMFMTQEIPAQGSEVDTTDTTSDDAKPLFVTQETGVQDSESRTNEQDEAKGPLPWDNTPQGDICRPPRSPSDSSEEQETPVQDSETASNNLPPLFVTQEASVQDTEIDKNESAPMFVTQEAPAQSSDTDTVKAAETDKEDM